MARRCTVCAHRDHEAIDLALLAGVVIAQLGKEGRVAYRCRLGAS